MESSVDATDGLMLDEIPPSTPDAYLPSQTDPSPFPSSVIEEDWERRRGFVIKEFITSEETYTKRLRLTLDLFVEPLRKHEILTTSEINTQFLNWELFVGLHQDLYENMVRDYDIGRLNLGERFKIFSHYLKAYSQYLTNYERARAERARLLTSNKRFYNFVEKVEASPESLQLPLESFLMEPVQRVPRYRMLFEQLLKFTPENHAEHEAVSDALRLTAEVSQSNADAIAQWEKKQRIMTIMMQLTPATRLNLLDDPSRELLREAVLQRQCRRGVKEFMFWLFSDKLLYGDRQLSASALGAAPVYSLNRDLSLVGCRVRSMLDDSRSASSASMQSNKMLHTSISTTVEAALDSSIDTADEGEERAPPRAQQSSTSSRSSKKTEADGAKNDDGECRNESSSSSNVIDALKGLGVSLGLPLGSNNRRSSGISSGSASPNRRQSAIKGGDDSTAFIFECPEKSFLVWAPTEEERNAWVDAINTAVSALREKNENKEDKGTIAAPLWTPDTAVSNCQRCGVKFGLVTRKHHCRNCGCNVCAACSLNRCKLTQVDKDKDVRVCNHCFFEIAESKADGTKAEEANNNSSPRWKPDVDSCEVCSTMFGIMNRRHHCRVCGSCVCSLCSPNKISLPHVDDHPVRACVRCFEAKGTTQEK